MSVGHLDHVLIVYSLMEHVTWHQLNESFQHYSIGLWTERCQASTWPGKYTKYSPATRIIWSPLPLFALRCQDESITPSSLKLSCPIRTENARSIIAKAEKSLVKERIRTVSQKVDNLKSRTASGISRLDSLRPEVKTQVIALAEKAREREYKHV